MIVGVATGLPVDSLVPWCASARKVYLGRIVLLTDEPQRYLPLESQYDIELVPAVLREDTGICDIVRTRWKALAELLEGESGPVCFVDTRDAVFQADPVSRIADKLMIGSEETLHRDNDWSLGWVKLLAPEWEGRLAGMPILCAGAIGGPAPLLRDFALAVYHRFPKIGCRCTDGQAHMGDQALVNVLWRDGFAAQADVVEGWVWHARGQTPAHLVDGRLLAVDGHPFPIVHQWDRVRELQHLARVA